MINLYKLSEENCFHQIFKGKSSTFLLFKDKIILFKTHTVHRALGQFAVGQFAVGTVRRKKKIEPNLT